MKSQLFATLLILITICSCSAPTVEPSISITDSADYESALSMFKDKSHKEKEIAKAKDQVEFWESKIKQQPTGYTFYDKLATVKDQQFELTGEISHLEMVDSIYKTAISLTAADKKSNFLLKRSANAIKLHQFNNARIYAEEAYPLAKEKYGSILMMYDAYMELGMYDKAAHIMETQRNYESFDYLVRYSKFLDHTGDLDSAVVVMQDANQLVKGKNEKLYTWSLASLGDMYGHQGKIKKSYETYLQVLDIDPYDHHVLKGIGYIAFAKDNDVEAAKHIFAAIDDQTKLPDYKLLLADIAMLEGAPKEYEELINEFRSVAELAEYENLYKKYLIEIYLEDENKKEEVITIAETEIAHRATPMTYQLLARAKMANGEVNEAAEMLREYVIGKSFEPELVYNSGLILLESGDVKNGELLLNEAKDAAFELGPLVMKNIEESLNKI